MVYGPAFNVASFSAWKVEVTGGGPIQVLAGADPFSRWSGGSVMPAGDGSQTGTQFWLHQHDGARETVAINVFLAR